MQLDGNVFKVDLVGFSPEVLVFADVSEEEIECISDDLRSLISKDVVACFTNESESGENPVRFEVYGNPFFWEHYREMETYIWTQQYRRLLYSA